MTKIEEEIFERFQKRLLHAQIGSDITEALSNLTDLMNIIRLRLECETLEHTNKNVSING